ncbi:MAG: HAD family hydrolase [Acidobacteria bacterium]|nr:MAG: HAD family hydrolase [Acidobacteriota bacterium]
METSEAQKAAFIDRDGTLIEEVNFLSSVDELRVFPYTFEAVKCLKDAGYLVIVVTNQSGIGRGIYDEKAMQAIHEAMQSQLDNMIDAFYFCPHLPCDGCSCRKPGLGMIESAMKDFAIDLPNSWMIGDKKIDVETGQKAGTRTAMVMTGYGRAHSIQMESMPDVLAEDLRDVVREVVR